MSEQQLLQAVRAALEQSGELRRVRAQLRSATFRELSGEDGGGGRLGGGARVQDANELVRDYLQGMGMRCTLSVFEQEASLAPAARDRVAARAMLAARLGLVQAPGPSPAAGGLEASALRPRPAVDAPLLLQLAELLADGMLSQAPSGAAPQPGWGHSDSASYRGESALPSRTFADGDSITFTK